MKLTIKELAKHLGKSEIYLRQLQGKGKLQEKKYMERFGISKIVKEVIPITFTRDMEVTHFIIDE
jgi:hypothetical protein